MSDEERTQPNPADRQQSLQARTARGNAAAALAILDRAPDAPPDAGDELPARKALSGGSGGSR